MTAIMEDLQRLRAVVIDEPASAAPPPVGRGPQPLPAELLPVDPFPLAAMPNAMRPWLTDAAERIQCPPEFLAVPMLVAAASLVARRVMIAPQARTDWRERANLWALVVGRPGTMKSPALALALAPLDRLEARAAAAHNARAAEWRAQALAAKVRADTAEKAARAALKRDPDADVAALLRTDEAEAEPTRARYVVADSTYEKLGAILAENPDGVLATRDELRGLLVDLGREERAAARAFYLQAWSGGPYTFDRIGRGTVTIPDARLSIIGGIQPGPLGELVRQARRGAADDGMLERFLVAWPDDAGAWRDVDRLPDSLARRRVWDVFERLDAIDAAALDARPDIDAYGDERGLPVLRFADEAREAFVEWHADLRAAMRDAGCEALEGALSKFRHHVPALALVLHVIDEGRGPVSLAPTLRALELAEYFASHRRRLHGAHRRDTVRAARGLLGRVKAGDLPNPFTARDARRKGWAGLSEREAVAAALDMLVDHGWLDESAVESGAAGGRPTIAYTLTEGARHG